MADSTYGLSTCSENWVLSICGNEGFLLKNVNDIILQNLRKA